MPGRGNLTTEGAYEKSLENTRRPLQPLRPPSSTSVPRINHQAPRRAGRQPRNSNRTRVARPKAKPTRKNPRCDPLRRPSSKHQHETSQLRSGAATRYQRTTPHSHGTDLSLVPRLKVSKKGASESGRLLNTIYDSSRRETLLAESVVRELGLPFFPWKPGNPVEVRNNKGFLWLEITHYVTVHGEVPGLSDADLGQCNFGIMPDDLHGLEGVEVAVGARVLEKLEADCGLSLETRVKIDLNFKGGLASPMPSTRDAGTPRRPGEMSLGIGHSHHQFSALLQSPTYDHSFGVSNTVSALPSAFSSNPASTPRTSLCASAPAQGMQHGRRDHDGGNSASQGYSYSFSQKSLTGSHAQETLGEEVKVAPGGFRQQTPQVPTLCIPPAMGSFGQGRSSVAGGYGPHAASPVYSTMSASSAPPAGTNLNPSCLPTNGWHLTSFSEGLATLGSQGTVSNPPQLPMKNEWLDLNGLSDFFQLFAPMDPSL